MEGYVAMVIRIIMVVLVCVSLVGMLILNCEIAS
jgi:hypothetical protein